MSGICQDYCAFLSGRNYPIDKHDNISFSFPFFRFHHFQLPILPYYRRIIPFSLNLLSPRYLNKVLKFRSDIFHGESFRNIGWETEYIKFALENPFLLLLTFNFRNLFHLNDWDDLFREYFTLTIDPHLIFFYPLSFKEYKAGVPLVIHQPIIIIFNRNISIPRHGLASQILHFYLGLPKVLMALIFLLRICCQIFNLAVHFVASILNILFKKGWAIMDIHRSINSILCILISEAVSSISNPVSPSKVKRNGSSVS